MTYGFFAQGPGTRLRRLLILAPQARCPHFSWVEVERAYGHWIVEVSEYVVCTGCRMTGPVPDWDWWVR